jgi:thiol-disulfide isomerase/thioredoxin
MGAELLMTRSGVAMVLVFLFACGGGRAAAPLPASLPAVALAPIAAAPASATLTQIAAGRPMLVDFFATWCAPCRTSMPRVQALAERHAPGLAVVGVSVGEDAADVAPFVRELGVTYPVYLDRDFALADAVGATKVPALLVVAADGRILHRAHELDAETLAAIDRALAPPP